DYGRRRRRRPAPGRLPAVREIRMNRGDVVVVPFPFQDKPGEKIRPAVVVQSDAENRRLANRVARVAARRLVCLGQRSANRRRGRSDPRLHHACSPYGQLAWGATRRYQTGFAHDVAPSWPAAKEASRWKRFLTPFSVPRARVPIGKSK